MKVRTLKQKIINVRISFPKTFQYIVIYVVSFAGLAFAITLGLILGIPVLDSEGLSEV